MKRLCYAPPFLSKKSEKSLQELGILPGLEGTYRFESKPPEVDAAFVSHGHLDHSAYLTFINRQTPVYCGETTKIILQALSEMRRHDLKFEIDGIDFRTFRTGDRKKIGCLEIEPVQVDCSISVSMASLFTLRLAQ